MLWAAEYVLKRDDDNDGDNVILSIQTQILEMQQQVEYLTRVSIHMCSSAVSLAIPWHFASQKTVKDGLKKVTKNESLAVGRLGKANGGTTDCQLP